MSAWAPSASAALQPGQASDREVAAAHGVCRETVTHYRRRHGIPDAGRAGRPAWAPDPTIEPPPGDASNAAVARAHGVNVKTVSKWLRKCGR